MPGGAGGGTTTHVGTGARASCEQGDQPQPTTQSSPPPPTHTNAAPPPHLALQLAEFVAEADEELAIALLLVAGQCQDAGQVVALLTTLLLAEVADLVVCGGRGGGERQRR